MKFEKIGVSTFVGSKELLKDSQPKKRPNTREGIGNIIWTIEPIK